MARKRLIVGITVALFISFSFTGCGNSKGVKPKINQEVQEVKVKKEEVNDLNVDIDTFIENFNSSNTVKNLGFTLDKTQGILKKDKFDIAVGGVNITFTLVEGTETISNIFVTSGGFGKQSTGEENILVYGNFIKGIQPEKSDSDIMQLMSKSGWLDKDIKNEEKYTINSDGIIFELLSLKERDLGTNLTVFRQ